MKIKESTSKKIGALTGKVVAEAKALPKKTASTGRSIKSEFVAGFQSTNSASREEGEMPTSTNNITQL